MIRLLINDAAFQPVRPYPRLHHYRHAPLINDAAFQPVRLAAGAVSLIPAMLINDAAFQPVRLMRAVPIAPGMG